MKTIFNKNICLAGFQKSLATTILLFATVSNANAQEVAPVQCKGMENAQCMSNTDCSWVQGYERKDGRKVSAFCRSKGTPKSAAASSPSNDSTEILSSNTES